jgi:hypothetical protein
MGKTYKSDEARKLNERPQKGRSNPPAQKVGTGKHAHPQPRGSQEKKGK